MYLRVYTIIHPFVSLLIHLIVCVCVFRCRISRILEAPVGNALLIGVGGSGKQSLCRLAAFLSKLEVFQITLRKGYGIGDLRVTHTHPHTCTHFSPQSHFTLSLLSLSAE